MPMPNKQITDGNYRYNFQGQEKDPETGMEAFELRLWDGRLGRWLTVDPAGQYYSPYVGMGNDPVNGIDPDGGCYIKNKDGSYSPCPEGKVGETKNDSFGYNWTFTGGKGWQLTNGAKDKVNVKYVPVLVDGTADYYLKRYVSHIQTFNTRPPDYYLSYGHKYINRFTNETNAKLSQRGKVWLTNTRLSLQGAIEKGLSKTRGMIAMDNEKFQKFVFETHVPSYLDNGLLLLSIKDKLIIGFAPDFSETLFDSNGRKQVLDIFNAQLEDPLFITQFNLRAFNWYDAPNCNCSK